MAARAPRVTAPGPALTCPPTRAGSRGQCLAQTPATRFSLREPKAVSLVLQGRDDCVPFHGPMEFAICDCLVQKRSACVTALNVWRL